MISTATIAAMIGAAPSQPMAVRRASFRSQPNRPAKAGSAAQTEAIPISASSESRRRFGSLTAWRASCARTGTCA
jgi:hypothetical protein